MPEAISLKINGAPVSVPASTTVAAAIAMAGVSTFRRSIHDLPRAPLCGMGICFECRVTINGEANLRSCQTYCAAGMEVRTDG